MKQLFVQAVLAIALTASLTSCKDEPNKTDASDAATAAQTTATAVSYKADSASSQIIWIGNKPTGSHTGTVNLKSGMFNVSDDAIVSGSFLIDMTTINSTDLEGDRKVSLDNHLMGTVEGKEGDFFNVNEFPTAAFEITGTETVNGKNMMMGNLSLKGVKKNIQFPYSVSFEGNNLVLKSEEFTIDRTDWGIIYGSKNFIEGIGDKFINDDMILQIKIGATK